MSLSDDWPDLPPEVETRALNIVSQINVSAKRGDNKKLGYFYAVFHAYRESGIIQDPFDLAQSVGIPPACVTKAFGIYSSIETGFTPSGPLPTAIDFIPYQLKKYGIEDFTTEDVISSWPPELKIAERKFPQLVALAMIMYHAEKQGKIELVRKLEIGSKGVKKISISGLLKNLLATC